MNIAQMMNERNMPIRNLQSMQNNFKNLSESQINEAVEFARRQGISESQINEGLRMIQLLKK